MRRHNHSIVWIDNFFHLQTEDVERPVDVPSLPHVRICHKCKVDGRNGLDDISYFNAAIEMLGSTQDILLTGPDIAKTLLMKQIVSNEPGMVRRIAGIESVAHPCQGTLAALAHAYFAPDGRISKSGSTDRPSADKMPTRSMKVDQNGAIAISPSH